jgi:hypothetical protein
VPAGQYGFEVTWKGAVETRTFEIEARGDTQWWGRLRQLLRPDQTVPVLAGAVGPAPIERTERTTDPERRRTEVPFGVVRQPTNVVAIDARQRDLHGDP